MLQTLKVKADSLQSIIIKAHKLEEPPADLRDYPRPNLQSLAINLQGTGIHDIFD